MSTVSEAYLESSRSILFEDMVDRVEVEAEIALSCFVLCVLCVLCVLSTFCVLCTLCTLWWVKYDEVFLFIGIEHIG